jgi:hypothetical protein
MKVKIKNLKFINPLFSIGWNIGFASKYQRSFPELHTVVQEFNEESKEILFSGANEILNYLRNQQLSYIYTSCGNNMFYEGKDAGERYKGTVEIKRFK